MNDRQLDELLKQELDALPRELTPGRNLYPGIEHAVNDTGFYLRKSFALAACLVLAISLVFSGGALFESSQNDAPQLTEFISLLQAEHERTKQTLMVEYQDQQALASDWEQQMEQLEQAEKVIYEALKEDSTNLELLKILRQVQSKQIDLIDTVYAPNFMII
jgi:hypothetical protein